MRKGCWQSFSGHVAECCQFNMLTLVCVLFGFFWCGVAVMMIFMYSHHLRYRPLQQIEHHDHHYVDLYGHRTALPGAGTGNGLNLYKALKLFWICLWDVARR